MRTVRAREAHLLGWVAVLLVPGLLATSTATAERRGGPLVSYLNVVAHPDDDLFFMNPDVVQAIRSGTPVTTVYVTAAEGDGRNAPRKKRFSVPVDFAGYSAARHAGVRHAYARMAAGDPNARWERSTLPTADGGSVELAELSGPGRRSVIRLIFLDVGVREVSGRLARLRGLWQGTVPALRTSPAHGSPVQTARTYTKAELLTVLTGLLVRFRPSVVRTLDPDPERGHDRKGAEGRTDHPDHAVTALLTRQAVETYEQTATAPVMVEYYRGYYNRHWPANLSPKTIAEKLGYIGAYGRADLQVGRRGARTGWPQATHHRYPGTGRWLVPQADGSLVAFAVVSGRVTRWDEQRSGGWAEGVAMSGPGFTADLSALRLPDGRLAVFGVRDQGQIVYAEQDRPSGRFGSWRDLGSRGGGTPVPVVDGTDRITVFTRDDRLGISTRTQLRDGSFGPWRGLGVHQVQDGIAAGTDARGRIELFAPSIPAGWCWNKPSGMPGIRHWRQRTPGGPLKEEPWPSPGFPVTGPLTVATEKGRLVVLARRSGTAEAVLLRNGKASVLPGSGGFGPLAAAAFHGSLVLAGRNDSGTVDIFGDGVRHETGGLFVQGPAVAAGARGQIVLAVLGPDGRLHLARRAGPSSWRWQAAGTGAPS